MGYVSPSSTAWRKGSIRFSLWTGQSCQPTQVPQHYLYPHTQGFLLHSFQFPPTTGHRGVVHMLYHTTCTSHSNFSEGHSPPPSLSQPYHFTVPTALHQQLYPLPFRQFWLVKFLVPTSSPLPLWHTYVQNSSNPKEASIFLQNITVNLNFYNMSQNPEDYHLYNICYEHLKTNSVVTCGHWHYNIQAEHMKCGWF